MQNGRSLLVSGNAFNCIRCLIVVLECDGGVEKKGVSGRCQREPYLSFTGEPWLWMHFLKRKTLAAYVRRAKKRRAISSCCLIFLAYLCFARYARCCYAVFVVPSGPRESYVEKSCTPLYSVAWQPFDRLLNGTRNRNVLF
jgi:hypothetical protein